MTITSDQPLPKSVHGRRFGPCSPVAYLRGVSEFGGLVVVEQKLR